MLERYQSFVIARILTNKDSEVLIILLSGRTDFRNSDNWRTGFSGYCFATLALILSFFA